MKIINKETGKRVGSKVDPAIKDHNKKLKEDDPIIRNVEKENESEELSAMDPPNAYDEKRKVGGEYAEMNKFLQELMDEHNIVKEKTNDFDKALVEFKENGYNITNDLHKTFNSFFVFFDEEILPHNQKEERDYFRILNTRLIESGEHGQKDNGYTAIELMEDDHVKFIQLASLTFNLLGLGSRLQDIQSRAITMDLAYNSGRELVELLRLHIFREDETLFPLSQQLLTEEDFKTINEA